MAENKTDYTKPRTDLVELLPEPLQSDVNLSIFDNVFNRYLTKQEIEKVAGYIGRGNPNALRSRQIHETDVHRQAYQLQPIPYNKIGSIEHMTSWKDMQNELERLGVDISDFNDWGTTQKFNWVPPIDINKIINYRDYYWVDKDEPNSTPQYITIRNTCATATARFNFWEALTVQYGSSMPIDEILPATDIPTTFSITDFAAVDTLKVEGDITDEILLGDFIDIINTTANDGTYDVIATPTYSGVTNETSIKVSTALVTGSPIASAELALRRFDKVVLNANSTLESGDYTGLYEEGFIFFVRSSTNTDLNNAFVEVIESTHDSFLKQTTVTINHRVTDNTADGEASLEEQLSIFETDKKCQCGDFGGWDISLWDDNPLEPLWGDDENAAGDPISDGISDHTNLIDRISHTTTPVSGVGVEGELWYDTVDNILYQADAAIDWNIIWRNFSLILERTTGIDLWDMSLSCDTRPRIDATTQWISQNHWLHKNDVVNFATVTRASLPIIEYDWDIELNEWTYINYNWSYRPELEVDFEPTLLTPPRIELEPLIWWEHGIGAADETITFDDRYGDLTDYFIQGQQVAFVDDLLKTTYTVVSSSYKTSGDFPYRTYVEFDKIPPTYIVGGTDKLDNLSVPSPNAISIIPLNSIQDEPWEDYNIHWRFDSADDSVPVPHQSLNPYMDIDDTTEVPIAYPPPPPPAPEPFTALLTPTGFVSSNAVDVDADFEVDWGDGNFISYPAGTASSVASGDITVQSDNEPTRIEFTTDTLTAIDITESRSLTSAFDMCNGLTNLVTFNIDDATNITTFDHAWAICINLITWSIGVPTSTSSVENFDYAWDRNWDLNSFPSIDTSAGTTFFRAWYDCDNLTSFPSIDTSAGIDFTQAWQLCASLLSFPALDFSAATILNSTWESCSGLLGAFPTITNTAGVTDFSDTWRGCNSITSFPLIDVSAGLDFSYAWYDCDDLTSFPAIDMPLGTDFTYTWALCAGLLSFPAINLSSGLDFNHAWYQCYAMTDFNLVDTSSGTNFSYAWYQCFVLANFAAIDTSQGTNFSDTWFDDGLLVTFPLLNMSQGLDFTRTWLQCDGLTTFPTIDMPLGTDFERTWMQCSSLTTFPLIDVSAGLTFRQAWNDCIGLTSFPTLNTGLSESFYQTWYNNSALTTFPALDVSSATDFLQTWYSCDVLESIGAIDTSSGTGFFETFRNCVSLVCLTSLDTTSASNTTSMFSNTPLLVAPDGTEQTALLAGSSYVNAGACPPAVVFLAVLEPVDFVTSNTVNLTGGDFEVDWGSGSFTTYPAGSASSVASGTITVRSDNVITSCAYSTNTFTAIDMQVSNTLTSIPWMCAGLSNMTSFDMDSSSVTDFTGAWWACSGLTSFPLIDTSAGVILAEAWEDCTGLTSFPVLDMTSAENLELTWFGLTSLASWPVGMDFSNVQNFDHTWRSCELLTSFPSIDTSAGTSFSNTFRNCTALLCITNLNTTARIGSENGIFSGTPIVTPDAATIVLLEEIPGLNYTNPGSCP